MAQLMQGVLLIDGQELPVRIAPGLPEPLAVAVVARDGDRIWVHWAGRTCELLWRDAVTHHAGSGPGEGDATARAPMPGSVIAVMVAPGDAVAAGDPLLTIESMKLETVIRAPRAGIVEEVLVSVGAGFDREAPLVRLAEAG